MEIYKRSLNQLTLHRFMVLAAIILIVYFILKNNLDYAIFILIVLTPLIAFPITAFDISNDCFKITNFYFGFIKKEFIYDRTNQNIYEFSIEDLESRTLSPDVFSEHWLGLIMFFVPTYQVLEKFLVIKTRISQKNLFKIKIRSREVKLIANFMEGNK